MYPILKSQQKIYNRLICLQPSPRPTQGCTFQYLRHCNLQISLPIWPTWVPDLSLSCRPIVRECDLSNILTCTVHTHCNTRPCLPSVSIFSTLLDDISKRLNNKIISNFILLISHNLCVDDGVHLQSRVSPFNWCLINCYTYPISWHSPLPRPNNWANSRTRFPISLRGSEVLNV